MDKQQQAAKVLIIDDDVQTTELYQEALQEAGLVALTVNDAQKALGSIKSEKPDLILLDILMPGISGLELLKKIKGDAETRKTPVVFLTNLRDDSTIKEGLESGAIGYLMKTELTAEQIVSEVKSFLEGLKGGSAPSE